MDKKKIFHPEKKLLFANWKMHFGPAEAQSFLKKLLPKLSQEERERVFIASPALSLSKVAEVLQGSGISWGGQNVHWCEKGAFTGENSPEVLKELGASFVILGHSERYQYFGESPLKVAQKAEKVQALGLVPLVCVGETWEERKQNRTQEVLGRLLKESLALLKGGEEGLKNSQVSQASQAFVVAYEPLWAIGTGQVASCEQIHETHAFIHKTLQQMFPSLFIPLLYGGSVKAHNGMELAQVEGVNGFLVGGASLVWEEFLALCHISNPSSKSQVFR